MSDLPSSFEDMTPAWLSHVVPGRFLGGEDIADVTYERLGQEGSFVGDIARLRMRYRRHGTGIESLIAKVPTRNEAQRQRFGAMGFYRKENAFYRDLAKMAPARVPVPYFVGESEQEMEYVLLLEDLQDMRTGDHLGGCSPDEAELVVEELAKLHARWWNDTWLDTYQTWLPPQSETLSARSGAWFASVLPAMRQNLVGMVPAAFLEFAEIAARRSKEIWALQAKSPFAVTHGDCRLENVMFGGPNSPARIALVDWQAVARGSPLRDLSYFLATNFEVERRRAEGPQLVRRYFEALAENGVSGYSLTDCTADLRRADLLLPWAVFWVAGSLDSSSPAHESQQLLRTVIRRQAQALLDADPMSVLGTNQ